ncbi:hypothetical protein [Brevibacillus porteri]|uniref:hypothetical protein n=1 Tax=Brevibacillus porteri TaxID=2126350 RepID=UPI003D1C3A26
MMTTIGEVQYNEVKRAAKEGDFVLFREAPCSYLTAGKPYEVTEIDSADDPQIIDDEGDEYNTCGDDFVVLEKITDSVEVAEMGNLIVHGGVQYRKADRLVRGGDVFMIPKESSSNYTAGKVYAITRIDEEGDPRTIDDDGDGWWLRSDMYFILEPVTPSLVTLETELAATKAKVAEMEAQLAEVAKAAEATKRVDAEAQRLKVGGYAKVTKSGTHSFKPDDLVKIYEIVKYGPNRIRCEYLDGKRVSRDHFYDYELVRATDEEVAEAKRKLVFDQFAKGDKVRLVSGGGEIPLLGFVNGDICEVVNPKFKHGRGMRVQITSGGGTGYATPEQLVKLTEAEVAEIERKKSEEETRKQEEAKWSAIGRKVGEFKKGDVVRVTHGYSEIKEGDIGIITEADGSDIPGVTVRGVQRYVRADLIVPVESIVSLRGGDAA